MYLHLSSVHKTFSTLCANQKQQWSVLQQYIKLSIPGAYLLLFLAGEIPSRLKKSQINDSFVGDGVPYLCKLPIDQTKSKLIFCKLKYLIECTVALIQVDSIEQCSDI